MIRRVLVLIATAATQLVAQSGPAHSPVLVTSLKTEHLSEPLGIETQHPRFRWLMESRQRGQVQTAYQLLVASSLDKLTTDQGDKWDSGKVETDNLVEVVYAGAPLNSGERCYWKVRIWDRDGRESGYSTPASFEMGLLRPGDWKGTWIAAKKGVSSPLLRREFSIDAPIRRARLYVSGLGYYELYLNGQKVGDRVLEPASTYYHNDQPFKLGSRVMYSAFDITDALRRGENAIGLMLGHGWFSGEADAPFRTPYADHPRAILQLNVELVDGRTFSLVTDDSWKTAPGPITYNDFAHGETYDARLERAGWDAPGFADESWDSVSAVGAPSGKLTAQLLPPARVVRTLPVLKRYTPREPENQFFQNAYTYDFGQNFTGWVRIRVSGPKGAKIVLRYGARLYPEDDTLDNRSNSTWVAGARQTDAYILKGEGVEAWEPRFSLHGFRYVEVRSFREEPSVESIEGRVVRSDVASAGSFSSSNDLLNRIHENIDWTLLGSFQGFPQDAADRAERQGWLGDPGFVAEDYIYNYDMVGFWEKWLNDIRDNQREDGAVPQISPLHARGEGIFPEKAWPSWQSTYPLLVWYLYNYYGDRRVLEEHYESLKKLANYQQAAAGGELFADEEIGDHMEPQAEGYSALASKHTPHALTANAYYYVATNLVAQIAGVLGRAEDARAYQRRAEEIKIAFNKRFLEPATDQYATGSQTSNALPLHLGLVPKDREAAVFRNLVADIENHNTHVTTGIIGSNAVVQVLSQHGAGEVMYRLATQTTYPSLGHQVARGATTVCETYEGGPWVSQNMKMFCSLDKFLYRDLAGIRPLNPGYRRVLIRPRPLGDLKHMSASQRTVRGEITVEWNRADNAFDLRVSVPAGMEAEIAIPKMGLDDLKISETTTLVWESGSYVPGTPGLTGAHAEGDAIFFEAGSGDYHFTLSGNVRQPCTLGL